MLPKHASLVIAALLRLLLAAAHAQPATYDVNFRFVDRGSPVALRAQLAVAPTGEPLRLFVQAGQVYEPAKLRQLADYLP